LIALLIAVALWVAFPVPASAAEAQAPAEASESRAPRVDKNLELDEVEILGEIEKPKIFFILPKAKRDAESRQRRIRFYPDILEPLDKDRFEEEARVLYQHGIPAE
jgi:hypothetical protein